MANVFRPLVARCDKKKNDLKLSLCLYTTTYGQSVTRAAQRYKKDVGGPHINKSPTKPESKRELLHSLWVHINQTRKTDAPDNNNIQQPL